MLLLCVMEVAEAEKLATGKIIGGNPKVLLNNIF
jgi:hypothetical protein